MKNKIILFLAFLIKKVRRPPSLFDKNNPKILIVTTTALGDTLWATPAIATIRNCYKKAHIACLTSSTGYAVLKNNPTINRFFKLKKPFLFSAIRLFFQLKKEKFQAILVMHASQRMVFPLCFLLNAEIFASTKHRNKGLDRLLTHTFEPDKKLPHEIERRLNILAPIGITQNKTYQLSYFFDKRMQT